MSDDLHGVMRTATQNLRPDVGKLTAGGIERGTRKRRNRRVSQIAGAAVSVTAVFGVVAMVGTPGHDGPGSVSAASGAVAGQGNPAVPQNAVTDAAPGKPNAAPVSGEQMGDWLTQALAPYHFTGVSVLSKSGTDGFGGAYATLKIGYDNSAGSVSLNVSRSPWQEQDYSHVPYIVVSKLSDGSHLMVFNGPEWPAGNGDPTAKRIDVSWYRTDGSLVDIMVLNAVQEKGATTSSTLGLTVDQATKVVQSPIWDKAIAAVLTKPAPNTQPKAKSETKVKGAQDLIKGSGPGAGPGNASSPAAPGVR